MGVRNISTRYVLRVYQYSASERVSIGCVLRVGIDIDKHLMGGVGGGG